MVGCKRYKSPIDMRLEKGENRKDVFLCDCSHGTLALSPHVYIWHEVQHPIYLYFQIPVGEFSINSVSQSYGRVEVSHSNDGYK